MPDFSGIMFGAFSVVPLCVLSTSGTNAIERENVCLANKVDSLEFQMTKFEDHLLSVYYIEIK